jgi:hypothetical protein
MPAFHNVTSGLLTYAADFMCCAGVADGACREVKPCGRNASG